MYICSLNVCSMFQSQWFLFSLTIGSKNIARLSLCCNPLTSFKPFQSRRVCVLLTFYLQETESYSETCRISKMECFAEIVMTFSHYLFWQDTPSYKLDRKLNMSLRRVTQVCSRTIFQIINFHLAMECLIGRKKLCK